MPTTLPVRRTTSVRNPYATVPVLALLASMAFFGAGLSLARTGATSTPVRDSSVPVIFADFGSPYLAWPIPIPP
jgi:hypothetical protein